MTPRSAQGTKTANNCSSDAPCATHSSLGASDRQTGVGVDPLYRGQSFGTDGNLHEHGVQIAVTCAQDIQRSLWEKHPGLSPSDT